ncbi:MAG: DNA-methyltransferase [Candidatus Hermodarchaeota archaeon]
MTFHLIYYGDCLDVIKEIEDNSIQLVVTSPPYYNAREYSKYETYQDYLNFMDNLIGLLPRVLVDGGYLCLNTTSYTEKKVMYPIPFDLLQLCTKHGFNLVWDVIWLKPKYTQALWRSSNYNYRKPYPYNLYLNCFHEYIWICRLGDQYREVTKEELETSKIIGEQIEIKGKLKDEKVLRYSYREWAFEVAKPSKEQHSASYPIELPSYCIELFSLKNDTVLDPFLGTGTTSKAAMSLGRNSVGIEVNKDYFDLIQKKLIPDHKNMYQYSTPEEIKKSGLKEHLVEFKNVDFITPSIYKIHLKEKSANIVKNAKKAIVKEENNSGKKIQSSIDAFRKRE